MADTGGFQVFNDSGIIQIDATYSNYRLYQSGSLSITASYEGTSYKAYALSSGRPNSILAVRSGIAFVVLNHRDSSGNMVHTIFTESSTSVEYWLFDDSHPGDLKNGMEIFNASGVRVFSATEKYMRVLSMNTVTIGSSLSVETRVDSPGFSPAVVHCTYSAVFNTTAINPPGATSPQYASTLSVVAMRVEGQGAWRSIKVMNTASIARGGTGNVNFSFMLLNVTNM